MSNIIDKDDILGANFWQQSMAEPVACRDCGEERGESDDQFRCAHCLIVEDSKTHCCDCGCEISPDRPKYIPAAVWDAQGGDSMYSRMCIDCEIEGEAA